MFIYVSPFPANNCFYFYFLLQSFLKVRSLYEDHLTTH